MIFPALGNGTGSAAVKTGIKSSTPPRLLRLRYRVWYTLTAPNFSTNLSHHARAWWSVARLIFAPHDSQRTAHRWSFRPTAPRALRLLGCHERGQRQSCHCSPSSSSEAWRGTSLIEHKTLLVITSECTVLEISDSVLVGEIVPGVPWIGSKRLQHEIVAC